MHIACKKDYAEGNLKDYTDVEFDTAFYNDYFVRGDTLFYTDKYGGLNYIPIDTNWAIVSDIEQYLADNLESANTGLFEPISIYNDLAEATYGRLYKVDKPADITDTIISLVQSNIPENSDIVFLIDKSRSMNNDIDSVKRNLNRILDSLPQNVRISSAAYSDNICEVNWYHSMQKFTNDFDDVRSFINALSAKGGCSIGESVYDAIYRTVEELDWDTSTENSLIIIGDEPPLKGKLSTYSYKDIITLCQQEDNIIKLYPIIIL